MTSRPTSSPDYLVGHIEDALIRDSRVNEQGLHVAISGGRVFVTGSVSTHQRRDAVAEVVRELVPDCDLHNEVTVSTDYPEPAEEEHLP